MTFKAAHLLEYAYTRSVGPVAGRFLTSLTQARIEGIRTASGRVIVPPTEYDPETAETLETQDKDFVEVGPAGTVQTWTWVPEPSGKQPLAHPFAWALIKLDGADTALLHAVDAGSEDAMATGMRVLPRWREQRPGMITDIECFEPDEGR